MSHILSRIGQLWRDRKIILRAGPELKFENYESVQHRPQFYGIKKGAKISFHRHFKTNYYRNSFAYTGAKIWNVLPDEIKYEKSMRAFKRKSESLNLSVDFSYM